MGRRPCCTKTETRKGAWTSEEDKILTDFIHLNGEGRWRNLPKRAGLNRCGKSCRLRWLNYLRPDIKRGNISDDEEDLIIRLHKLLGNRWSLIAGRLPGRTDNEIKNYWNTTLRKKAEDNCSFPKTPKHYKRKKDDKPESSQHNVVDSKTIIKSPTTTSLNKDETEAMIEPEEGYKNLELDDICLTEFLTSDSWHLFESNNAMTSNSSPSCQRPIVEIPQDIWNAEDINTEPNSKSDHHYFDSVCVGDWLV